MQTSQSADQSQTLSHRMSVRLLLIVKMDVKKVQIKIKNV